MERKTFKLNLGSFDFAKGLGMITVILVHTVSYYNTENSYVLQGLFFYLKLVAAGIIPTTLFLAPDTVIVPVNWCPPSIFILGISTSLYIL